MSIEKRQKKIIDDFNFFDDWSCKYAYLISLGKALEPFPDDKKNDAFMVKGCQSQVWFDVTLIEGRLKFYAVSDSAIVSGLIGLLLKVYSGVTANEIIESNTDFMVEIDLAQHLSPTRNSGLHAMIHYIYTTAKRYVDVSA